MQSEGQRSRLLIVDDAAENVEALRATLSRHGYDTVGFTDPAKALKALRRGGFDLLLTDLKMPEMSGMELLRRAQRNDPDLIGIIMTGEGSIASAVEAMKTGALDYVLKPLKLSNILPVLSRAIAMRTLRTKNAALERNIRERTVELERALRDLENETAERLRTQQALLRAQKLEAIGRLTGGVAHDFNNLLMAIDGAFQLLDKQLEPDHRGRKYVDMGRRAAERGTKVISHLRAFSHTQKLDLEPTEICAALRKCAPMVAHALGPTISLELDIPFTEEWAQTDSGQLELALINLATNARDAMPDGGAATLGARRATSRSGDPFLGIWLQDTGAGMSEETAARAVEPFFTTKKRGKGSGLGLAQVYAFARQCGGDVSITTAPASGTTVCITLPSVSAPPTDKPLLLAGHEDDTLIGGEGRRLLVVDDDDFVRTILVDGLRFQGFEVAEAPSGFVALKELKAGIPDALVLDYAMPGMNGDEVAQRAREMRPDLPIVFCSGFADSLALQGVEGARVIRKPVAVGEIARVVLELTAKRQPAYAG
jgi:signal transduction histidine kinase